MEIRNGKIVIVSSHDFFLQRLRSFASAIPDFVVEIQSSTQRPSAVRAKLALFLEKGSTAGPSIPAHNASREMQHRIARQAS